MGKLIRFRRKPKIKGDAERALFPPFRQPATDARPASYPSDACASDTAARPGAEPDPVIVRKERRKRGSAIFAFIFIFTGGTFAALFGVRGCFDVQRQNDRLAALRADNDARQLRVDALKRENDRLRSDPAAVERIAREELGYVAPGEITLLLPGDTPAREPGLDAKTGSGIVPAARRTP